MCDTKMDGRNFVDYFAVCGLDVKMGLELEANETCEEESIVKSPLERSYKCRTLHHFPDNLPWNPFDEDAITQLCFPKGLVFQKHNSKPKFHPFIITREDGSRVYAGTLTFFELIEEESICNAMQSLQTMYDADAMNSKNTMLTSLVHHSLPVANRSNRSYFSMNNSRHNTTTDINTTPVIIKSHQSTTTPNSDPTTKHNDSNEENENFSDEVHILSTPDNTSHHRHESPSTKLISNFENVLKSSNGTYINNLRLSFSNNNNNTTNTKNTNNLGTALSSFVSPAKISHYSTQRDRLYAAKCICIISQYPFNRAFSKVLHTLYDMVEKTDLLGINLESHLYNLIYDIPLPPLGSNLKFHIGCKAIHLHLPDYANANDLPLFDYDMFEFFRLLGVSNVINLYIAALLEHQVLLYSKDYSLLMLVAESLTTLFFPFTWLKPYVPLVPASNLHFIEAPVPYIMGFHHRDIDKEFFKQGQRCFVDIDSGTVSCPEGLPEFPDKNKFIKEINDLIVYFGEKRSQCVTNKKRPSVDVKTSFFKHSQSQDNENLENIEQPHLLQTDNSTYDILQNSQAFARVTELARKAGAFNDESFIDTTTGRLKTLTTNFVRFSSPTSSSGVSSASSTLNSELSSGIESLSNFFNGSNLLKKIETENQNKTNEITSSFSQSISNENKPLDEETVSIQFTRCIRELFLQRFVEMFVSYEKFVIVPNLENNKLESWWMSREYSGNFDSKMFLIEQPSPRLPFLSHFIASQMFVTFIDLKIISLIDPNKSPDPNIKIFDARIKHYKENELKGMNVYDLKMDTHKSTINVKEIEDDTFKKLNQTPIIAPTVRQINHLIKQIETSPIIYGSNFSNSKDSLYLFENIDDSLLKTNEEYVNRIKNDIQVKKEISKKREQFGNTTLTKLSLDKPIKRNKEKKSRKNSGVNTSDNKSLLGTSQTDSNEKTTELNPIFIQSLLKESKLKTKRMLVEKMPEVANLGHGEACISGVEENMLIASLCDLIERIWGHGLHSKPGKSSLWNHLSNYRKLIQYLHPNSQLSVDPKSTPPTLLWCLMKKQASSALSTHSIFYDKTNHKSINAKELKSDTSKVTNSHFRSRSFKINSSQGSCTLPRKKLIALNNSTPETQTNQNLSPHFSLNRQSSYSNLHHQHVNQQHKRAQSVNHQQSNEHSHNTFPPLKNDLLGDLSRIDKLTEVKTEIGMARAFVRLSLEKKLLADHLRQLLSECELLRALYKRHAFLRQEDEREQFIYHLQSLNVVDYFCFTNYFKSIPTDYSVLIVPSKRFNASTTSANPYMKLFGSLGESDVFSIPKNNFEFVISCNNNLGPLTTLIVGHDNAGITPRWMIECIFVRNEITGHIHKFPCGRWLGKGVDDDSLERLLIAEPVTHNESYDLPNIQLLSPYSTNGSRSRSPTLLRSGGDEKKQTAPAVQEMLGNSINTLVKFFEKSESERGSLTSLMCGENGLVNALEHIFTFGFKSYKLFKRLYVWDFLEKSMIEFETQVFSNAKFSINLNTSKHFVMEKYANVIKTINSTSSNYGKDGKFQIFVCLACRDSFMSDWFSLLSQSNTATQMYDEFSFMRNYELNKFAVKILSITNQFNFKLENSLTMGIHF